MFNRRGIFGSENKTLPVFSVALEWKLKIRLDHHLLTRKLQWLRGSSNEESPLIINSYRVYRNGEFRLSGWLVGWLVGLWNISH